MTSTGNAKKRIFYYDFLRCFAILSVIAALIGLYIVIKNYNQNSLQIPEIESI